MINWELIEQRMNATLHSFEHEMSSLRTGRASPTLLHHIPVDVYGCTSPLLQVAHINVLDSRTLTVSVWDKNLIKNVEKSIRESSLNLNPSVDGNIIRVPLPVLTEERRIEIKKLAALEAERARIAVRNIRRDFMGSLKKLESEEGKDSVLFAEQKIQNITDQYIQKINTLLMRKEQEIMQV